MSEKALKSIAVSFSIALLAVGPALGQGALPTSQDRKAATELLAELDQMKRDFGDSAFDSSPEIMKRAVTLYNRTCQTDCAMPCPRLYTHVANEPGVARICRAN